MGNQYVLDIWQQNQTVARREVQFANSNLQFGFRRDKRVVRVSVRARNKQLGALPNNSYSMVGAQQPPGRSGTGSRTVACMLR